MKEMINIYRNDLFPEMTKNLLGEIPFGSMLLYIPEKKEFLFLEYGSGENLLREDRAAGYDDYINIQTYSYEMGDFEEEDGGMLMLRMEKDWANNWNIYQHIGDALFEMYDEKPGFIILQAV